MSSEDRRSSGYGLVVLGAAGVALSLWLPWYSIVIPQWVLNEATQNASQYGVLAPLITSGAKLLAHLGPVHVSAWKVMTVTPAFLLVASVAGGGLALLTLTGRAEGVAGAVTACGAAACAIVIYRLLSHPGSLDLLHPGSGLYVALGGGAAMVLGGVLAARSIEGPATNPVTTVQTAVHWSAANSVPPPSE